MEITEIEPRMLKGRLTVPPSKSIAHRAVLAAFLSKGKCVVKNLALSKDLQATLGCIRALGGKFYYDSEKAQVIFSGVGEAEEPAILDCEESGSTLRFLMPIALLERRRIILRGKGRLMQRPQTPYLDLFAKKGISCKVEQDTMVLEGSLEPGLYQIPGDVSSQFITGLLFALPLLEGDSQIEVTTETESKGYIDLTLSVLREFGITIFHEEYRHFRIPGRQQYSPRDYCVEGDYSQAAFFLVAGALGCDVQCRGLNPESMQGDKKILEILKDAGAEIQKFEDGTLQVSSKNQLQGLRIDAREIPDLVPILSVLCAFCKGESQILNAGRLRLKESDRLSAMATELTRMGALIEEGKDSLWIQGKDCLQGATVSAWNDHRVAMSLAIAACRCNGTVRIEGAKEAVQKSYPDFWEEYHSLAEGTNI